MNAAMHAALRGKTSEHAALPQANQAVTSSVLMMLRPDRFDSVGTMKSLWMHRLQSGTDHADRVLDELKFPDIELAETAAGVEMVSDENLGRWYV